MDDDILCEPETVLRLNAFANLTRVADPRRRADAVPENPDYLTSAPSRSGSTS